MQKSGGLNYRSEDAGIWQRPHSGLCFPATAIFSPFVKDQFNKVLPGPQGFGPGPQDIL